MELILKKILITGASGCIGRSLLNEIAKEKNLEIIATYRRNKLNLKLYKNIQFIKLDINEKRNDWYSFLGKPDIVVHLAWDYLNNFEDNKHESELLQAHFLFISNLLKNGLKNILIAGTCLEYGKIEGELNEKMKPEPIIPYAISKNKLRLKLLKLKRNFNFNYTWLRFFYIFGKNSNSRLYNDLTNSINKRNKYFKMSNGDQIRDFININILTKHIKKIVINHKNNGIINICSGNPISIKSLVKKWIIKKKSSIQPKYGYYKYISYEPMKFWGSTKKLNKLIKK